MYKIYIAYCTKHYDDGRTEPDGISISTDMDKLKGHIRRNEQKRFEDMYWRHDKPRVTLCDRATFDLIMDRMIRGTDVAMFPQRDLDKLKFFY